MTSVPLRLFGVIDSTHYRHFKATRQEATLLGVDYVNKGTADDLCDVMPLTMLMALIYASNALCSRPEEGGTWKELRWATLKSTFHHGEEHLLDGYGLFFIADLAFNRHGLPVIRGAAKTLNEKIVARAFGFKSWKDLTEFIEKRGKKKRISFLSDDDESQLQVAESNKRPRTQIAVARTNDACFFRLEEKGIEIPRLNQGLLKSEATSMNSDERAFQLFKQFISDVITKFPTGKQGNSHLTRLGMQYRTQPTERFFQVKALGSIFNQFAFATGNRWETTLDLYFPSRNMADKELPDTEGKSTNCEGWKTFLYRKQYMKLRSDHEHLSSRDFKTFRSQILKHINTTFKWFPVAYIHNAFSVKQANMHSIFPPQHTGAAPVVILNPNANDLGELKVMNITYSKKGQKEWMAKYWDKEKNQPKDPSIVYKYFDKDSTSIHPFLAH